MPKSEDVQATNIVRKAIQYMLRSNVLDDVFSDYQWALICEEVKDPEEREELQERCYEAKERLLRTG